MKIAGIVAEYNPFHNGHKYHLEETRRMGATHIVVVMSGAAVQRGDIAIADKYERAQAALKYGADLVIELPCPYSCSSAERFAKGAIQLLAGFGENGIDMLSFGCETDDLRLLNKAAEISAELDNSAAVKDLLESGVPYPSAIAQAAGIPAISAVFGSPNNILAIEYIKALKKYASWIEPLAVKRKGAAHDSSAPVGGIASGSYIRELIRAQEDYSELVPQVLKKEPFLLENSDKALLLKIMTATTELSRLPDMSSNLVLRFMNTRDTNCELINSVSDFASLFKNKSITLARVRRTILYLALDVTSRDFFDVPYGRILALNERGREIFAACDNSTLDYNTSLTKLEKLSSQAKRISLLERNAAALQQLSVKGEPEFANEYTRKIALQR